MRKETREAIGSLKTQMLEAAATLTSEEREEFYNEVNEWTLSSMKTLCSVRRRRCKVMTRRTEVWTGRARTK